MLTLLFFALLPLRAAVPVITPDEITPGMKGYGLTVMQGETVERFEVEAISVVKKMRPQSDAILVKISGLNLEHTGIIQGMSGAPVYFDGKLAGALSFGWQYSIDGIAGITPIGNMRLLYEHKGAASSLRSTNALGAVSDIGTPLLFSGFSSVALDAYADAWRTLGFTPLQSGGAREETVSVTAPFVPGDACAIMLIDGDMNAAGVGTVTESTDKGFLLFGHSMYGGGRVRLPVAKASIKAVIPSMQISFKLGVAIGAPLGYTTFDGELGVAGAYGPTDELMTPVTITTRRNGEAREFNIRIVNEPTLFPNLLASAMLSCIASVEGSQEEIALTVTTKLHTPRFKTPLTMTNRFLSFMSGDTYREAAKGILGPVETLMYNRFERLPVTKVEIIVDVANELNYAFIEELRADKNRYAPGETVALRITLRDGTGALKTETMRYRIPHNALEGTYSVFLGNEYAFEGFQQQNFPAKYTPRTIDELIAYYAKPLDANKMIAWMYVSTRGVTVEGETFERLPSSYYEMFASEPVTGKGAAYSAVREEKRFSETAILGAQSLSITVRKKDR